MKKRILVVAAHPDDEVLGCGGTMARLVSEGAEVNVLILGEGITSRNGLTKIQKEQQIKMLHGCANDANKILGVKQVYFSNFPDNSFDIVALLEIVKNIEQVKTELQPDIIFTHYEHDLNVDHQLTFKAVLTATRPIQQECVKEIYSFEVLSSTEWNFSEGFRPDVFFNIGSTIQLKKKALEKYVSEMREFPHPRSLKGIETNAMMWGIKVGFEFAEAFKCIRIIR
jgi:LmbE family N-acetylglucosaminyl deacetylase